MAKTYTPIVTTTLTTNSATITFSSLPSTYTDLIIVFNARSATVGSSTGTDGLELQFNSDTGANYSYTQMYGNGSSGVSSRSTGTTSAAIGNIPIASNTTSPGYEIATGNIMNYANSTTYKTVLGRGGPSGSYTIGRVGLWRNTAAITSVTGMINGGGSFLAGSTATLYGIKAA
jgi:hypothetical protein